VAGRRLLVPHGEAGVGRLRYERRVLDEEPLLLAAVEVAVRLYEPLTVGQEVGRLVVVGGVTGDLVAPLDGEDVDEPDRQTEDRERQQPAPEPAG